MYVIAVLLLSCSSVFLAAETERLRLNVTGGVITIVSDWAENKCLDLPEGKTDNGNMLQIWDCNGMTNQQWLFDSGSWRIKYAGDSGKCIDALGWGGSGGAGTQLGIWDCNGHDSQSWGYDSNLKTIYLAHSADRANANLCMDIDGGQKGDGTRIQVWDCNLHTNQAWDIRGGGQSPSPGPGPSGSGKQINIRTTFYGYPDNCPPSASKHWDGTGTYDNPIGLASAPSAISDGTMVYIEQYKKYFVMDDECEECEHHWKKDQSYLGFDLWLGPNHFGKNIVGCEDAMDGAHTATLNPPNNLPVDTTPFYDADNDKCMRDAHQCHETCDPSHECNECDGQSGSCEDIAKKFNLSVECFKKLNPNIDCDKGLHGQTFCQGSGCGQTLNFFELV